MAQPNLLLVSATEIESATIQTALGNAKTAQHARQNDDCRTFMWLAMHVDSYRYR